MLRAGEHEKNTLDVILFIHSIYYVDVERALLECYEYELNETGFILCVIEKEGTALDRFFTSQHLRKYHNDIIMYTSKDVVKDASKHNWAYQQFSFDVNVDVSQCFDEKSEEGNLLLDFFFHIKDHRRSVSKEELTETLGYLKNLCSSENENGKLFLKGGVGVIVINKSR